jgi:hypothetical protein
MHHPLLLSLDVYDRLYIPLHHYGSVRQVLFHHSDDGLSLYDRSDRFHHLLLLQNCQLRL